MKRSERLSPRSVKQEFPLFLSIYPRPLALLKAEGKFSPLPVAASRGVKLGGPVATVGFPNMDSQGFAGFLTVKYADYAKICKADSFRPAFVYLVYFAV